MSNITIPRQILIDAKRDMESHIAPHMLERTCPAYRQITAVLSEDYKPRTVSNFDVAVCTGEAAMSLPPLPKPSAYDTVNKRDYYTEAQMLAFQAATVEACAKVCDSTYSNGDGVEGWFEIIAEKLRNLK